MTIVNRKERLRAAQRAAILTAAEQILHEEGWRAVTVRKIAARIEYSAPLLYEHFASKEAVLLEIMRQGFAALGAAIAAAEHAGPDPGEWLARVAAAYWDFALQKRELYQLMHGLGGVSFGTEETPVEARQAFQQLRRPVQEAFGHSGRSQDEIDRLVEVFWCDLHGLVSLTLEGRIKGGSERARTLLPLIVGQLAALCKGGTP
jgi:AcrR family transcriptional regulator